MKNIKRTTIFRQAVFAWILVIAIAIVGSFVAGPIGHLQPVLVLLAAAIGVYAIGKTGQLNRGR